MKILFLYTANSCRSQMAEGYTQHFGEDKWEVKSAGLQAKGVNPHTIAIMKEDGVDISQQSSALLTKHLLEWADVVVTLCGDAHESCPNLPKGTEKRHWPFEDPAKADGSQEEVMMKFRAVRDGIKTEVINLFAELKSKRKFY